MKRICVVPQEPHLLPASTSDWDEALEVIDRLGAARKKIGRDINTLSVADSANHELTLELDSPLHADRRSAVLSFLAAMWTVIAVILAAVIIAAIYLS